MNHKLNFSHQSFTSALFDSSYLYHSVSSTGSNNNQMFFGAEHWGCDKEGVCCIPDETHSEASRPNAPLHPLSPSSLFIAVDPKSLAKQEIKK